MAAPESMTTADFSGTFVMNRMLSGNTDECLQLQGIGWITRKVLSATTVTIKIEHTTNDAGLEALNITTTLTGGIKAAPENRVLDWEWYSQVDPIFGTVASRVRRVKLEDLTDEYLKEGWVPGTESVIEIESDNPNGGWKASQTWGFEFDKHGVKRYARKLKLTAIKSGKTLTCPMLYDYIP